MTGTVLQGSLAVNDTVEIPALKVGGTQTCQCSELETCLKACNTSQLLIFKGGVLDGGFRGCQFNVKRG